MDRATGHLIVPALSRRRVCRREPLGVNYTVNYTNKQSHIVSVLSLRSVSQSLTNGGSGGISASSGREATGDRVHLGTRPS